MRSLQIILVLLVAGACATFSTNVKSPSKPKGKNCKPACAFGAKCDRKDGKCECRPKRDGNPYFLCYDPKRYIRCQIMSDPMLSTYDGQSSGIKMPGSLALTSVTSRRFAAGRGMCQVALSGWTERFGGKYFIKALQFKLHQITQNGTQSVVRYRIITRAPNGEYFWEIYKDGVGGWGLYDNITSSTKRVVVDRMNGCAIRFLRYKSTFLTVNVICCVMKFAIRPFNEAAPDIIPGVYVLVRKSSKMTKNSLPSKMTINSLPICLCNNATDSPQIDVLKGDYGFNSRTQYSTFTALAYGRPVNHPDAYPQLGALQATLRSCDEAKAGAFMVKAEFLFNYPKLIGCEGNKMMDLIHMVAKGFCNNDVGSCNTANSTFATDCPAVSPGNNDVMKDFMKFGCV